MFQNFVFQKVVFSSDTAIHILLGKAYARALRAHFLVKSALELIVLQFISPLSLSEHLSTCDVDREYLCYSDNWNDNSFHIKYQNMLIQMVLRSYVHLLSKLNKTMTPLLTIETSLKFCKSSARCEVYLSETSGITQLWIQYIHYINIIK